ncbi:MAG TPA: alcohol dehydrogenase catalytic domain-containing protein [Acidimicrobiales bacterium]|nr:alcohol dehydrogenase catalytic domain-containing protein [Acidimicrobiales bacterium]
MRAVRSTGDLSDKVVVVDVDEPPGSGELVQIRSASICSSDLMYIGYGFQRILGHELAGTRADGSPVVVEALFGCGTCAECRRGRYNLCPAHHERALGVTIDGGMAEWYRAPSDHLVPLPAELDIRDAALVEPASVSWHALRLASTGPDTRVAIVGAGGLGLLAAVGARHLGAPEVAIEARHDHQREAAERLGATVGTDGLYDVVIEAAGTEQSLARCTELVAPRGTIAVVGVHTGATLAVPWHPLFMREAQIVPSLGYGSHDGRPEMADVAAMLADDPEIACTVITHRFPLEDAPEAFRVAADKSSGAIRVVLEP